MNGVNSGSIRYLPTVVFILLSCYRYLFVAVRRSPLVSNPGSCELTYLCLIAEQRHRGSNGDMWQLYISRAEKHDPQLAEHWKGQIRYHPKLRAYRIVFVGGQIFHPSHQACLFSIVVSIFLTKTIGGLQPNSTELLLGQISLQLRYLLQHSCPLRISCPLVPATWTSP